MTCEYCDCKEISGSLEALQPLFGKLEQAKFSGELRLEFEAGEIASGRLKHFLPLSELGRELPTIEEEKEFALKP